MFKTKIHHKTVPNSYHMFPQVIIRLICEFVNGWHLLEWIDPSKLTNYGLCGNPRAKELVRAMRHCDVSWVMLQQNKSHWAMQMIEHAILQQAESESHFKFLEDVTILQKNEYANPLLARLKKQLELEPFSNPDPESWKRVKSMCEMRAVEAAKDRKTLEMKYNDKWLEELAIKNKCSTPKQSPYYLQHKINELPLPHGLFPIDWQWLALNTNDDAVAFLQSHPEHIDLDLIQQNPKWTNWYLDHGYPVTSRLSGNSHPRAIAALRLQPDVINWDDFSANPGIFVSACKVAAKELATLAW